MHDCHRRTDGRASGRTDGQTHRRRVCGGLDRQKIQSASKCTKVRRIYTHELKGGSAGLRRDEKANEVAAEGREGGLRQVEEGAYRVSEQKDGDGGRRNVSGGMF